MTSPFPNGLDNDATLPLVVNNITTIGGQAINALRDATFAIESNIGINAQGATSSISARLSQSLDPSGNILPSAIASAGLITLPIVDSMISATAGIEESKLSLNYGTSYLNNFITNVNTAAQTGLSFISNFGYKLEPHIDGSGYYHYMDAILVAISSAQFFNNASGAVRNNTNLYDLFVDVNNDLVSHEVANGTPVSFVGGLQVGGTLPPTNYGHVSAGIYVNSSTFSFIPQTITDVQALADFIDSSNILILGTRIQTLYANGVPINARAGALPNQTLGQLLVPPTNARAYLLYSGANSPVDNIDHGDDLVEFFPSSASSSNNSFDAVFNLVKPGDILTVDYDGYGNFSVQYIIREIKYSVSGGNKRYVVRIDGKNIINTSVIASINSPLFNNNKYGVMALSQVQTLVPGTNSTLIAGSPRGAEVLGVGFDPDLINSTHYLLYLSVYPDGNPLNQVFNVPPIDISGNAGATPGAYTLDNVMAAINAAFRTPGFNNRFMAFQYNGELGIKMTDAINNISFTVIDGIVNSSGLYDQALSNTSYPNNVIGVPGFDLSDATGFGINGAGVSSPAFAPSYTSPQSSLIPTKIWCPLSRKTYYVNGVEREGFALEPFQLIDGYGDGYWPSTIISQIIVPGTRVETTYQVPFDLATSSIEVGKTITAIAQAGGSFVDDGRYFITNIQFNNCLSCGNPDIISTTNITVYDAIQSPSGNTPYASAPIGTSVFLYFSSDSISFNAENVSDWSSVSTFKRNMEIYVNQDGYTFTQERGRMNINGSSIALNTPNGTVDLFSNSNLIQLDMVSISPKLRGFAFGTIDKINLTLTSYNTTTGVYSGYLCKWDGTTESNQGPITIGKIGHTVRFYDNSYVQYIDFALDFNNSLPNFSSISRIDIQLFPTLELDQEVMLLGTVQIDESNNLLSWLQDERQFGNVSEEQFTTSAIDYIAAPTQLINENGIIQGFNIVSTSTGSGLVQVNGGVAIVNGKIVQLGSEVITIPAVVEVLFPSFTTQISTITWFLCVNQEGELELVASTDFDPFGTTAPTYAANNLDHTRIFYVSNTGVGNDYAIRGTYFSNLITNVNNQDVVPIAIITATTSGATPSITSISSLDARRFMSNGYSGLSTPFVLSSSGSFRTINALNNWLNQLVNLNAGYIDDENAIGIDVIIKGNVNITSTHTLDFLSPVRFVGDGGAFEITTDVAFNINNNISFDGITFNYNYDPLVAGDAGYHTANLVNSNNGLLYCNTDVNHNITIKNCIFNWVPTNTSVAVNRYPFISFQFSATGNVAENINISNNIFNSQLANQPDVRAAIAFISTIQTVPTLHAGVQLVNCEISNNKCYLDQMIIISAFLDGSSTLDCAITTINTNIVSNQCGTIGFITRYYNTNDFNYLNVSPGGRNPSITISNNTCKLIDALDGAGAEFWFSANLDTDMITGASIIENNTVSWIRILLNANDTVARSTTSIIKHNNLSAYNTAYRFNYNSVYSTANSDNSAISVVNPNLFDGYAQVVIDGNNINRGVYNTAAPVQEIYYYDTGILAAHNSTIVNNIITSLNQVIAASAPIGIHIINPISIVENNKLYRGAIAWSAYVDGGSPFFPLAQHIIKDNFFDQTTVDGSNDLVNNNIPNNSLSYSNINQIRYAAISWLDHQNYILPSGGLTSTSTNPAVPYSIFFSTGSNELNISRMISPGPPFTATSLYMHISDYSSSTNERNISFTLPLDNILPLNVKILSITMGVYITESSSGNLDTSSTNNNKITLSLMAQTNLPTSGSTFGIADVKNNTGLGSGTTLVDPSFSTSNSLIVGATLAGAANTTENLLASNTQYCTITTSLSGQNHFTTTGKLNRISASLDFNTKRSAATAGIDWWFSPILIQYQW